MTKCAENGGTDDWSLHTRFTDDRCRENQDPPDAYSNNKRGG